MVGPPNFSTDHECGLLVEGYDFTPQILENSNHHYHRELFESEGLVNAMDLLKSEIRYEDRPRVLPIIAKLLSASSRNMESASVQCASASCARRSAPSSRSMTRCGRRTGGSFLLTDHECDHMVKELSPVLDEDFARVAETSDGQAFGVALSLPDFNRALSALDARLLPLGWLHAGRERRRINEIRVFALDEWRAYQHTGVGARLYHNVWEACARRGIESAETGWILETNKSMNAAMEALAGRIVKRYRIYERPLG